MKLLNDPWTFNKGCRVNSYLNIEPGNAISSLYPLLVPSPKKHYTTQPAPRPRFRNFSVNRWRLRELLNNQENWKRSELNKRVKRHVFITSIVECAIWKLSVALIYETNLYSERQEIGNLLGAEQEFFTRREFLLTSAFIVQHLSSFAHATKESH